MVHRASHDSSRFKWCLGTVAQLVSIDHRPFAISGGGNHNALRSYFDSNGDGKLTNADALFGQFRIENASADGTMSVQTLAQAGITEIGLKADMYRAR